MPPGVSISVPSGVQNGGFDAPITFTEPVSGFGGTDVTVSGTATVRVSHVGTIDYIKYGARIIPETSGTVVLNIAQGVATDAANNANTAATEQTVTVNLDLLTVKIFDSNSRTRSSEFTVLSVFSHPVSDFGSTDVALSGTATASVASVRNIARYKQFHIAIQPTANGTLTVSIPTGGATNAAGNTNIASNSIDFTIELAADDSPEMTPSTIAWMPDGSLVDEVVSALGLADASTLTQAKMGELTTFSAKGAGILSLTGLEHATNLTSLNLESNHITDIRPIKGLANLTYLNLSHNELGEVTLSNGLWIHHHHWPNLRELDLSHNNISCDTASLFSDHDGGSPRTYADPLPSLTRLDVSYNTGLNDAALFWGMGRTSPGIHRLNLTHLDIRYTSIDNVRTILYDYAVSHVGSANRIEWLRVEGTTFYELYKLRQIRKTLGQVIGPEIEYLIDVIDIDVEVPYSAYSSTVPLSPPAPEEERYITDGSLRAAIREKLGLGDDELLTKTKILELTELDLSSSNRSIYSTIGLEHATNLTSVDLSNVVNFRRNGKDILKGIYHLPNLETLKLSNPLSGSRAVSTHALAYTLNSYALAYTLNSTYVDASDHSGPFSKPKTSGN